MFPCLTPASPHMRSENGRFQTFDDRWPAIQVRATPRQISRAGFFFLGERDRVKCWYCNGGLQNWDPDDEPWTEHAKWFPTYVLLILNLVHMLENELMGFKRNIHCLDQFSWIKCEGIGYLFCCRNQSNRNYKRINYNNNINQETDKHRP